MGLKNWLFGPTSNDDPGKTSVSEQEFRTMTEGVCDVCGTKVGSTGGSQISAAQMNAIARKGFNPYEHHPDLAGPAGAFGVSIADQLNSWREQVQENTTDWRLCSQCTSLTKPYLNATSATAAAPLVDQSVPNKLSSAEFELAGLAARRRWQEPDLAADAKHGSRKCDTCDKSVAAGAGRLIEAALPRAAGAPASVSPEVQSINGKLQAIWRQMSYSTGQCANCGLMLITGGGMQAGIAGLANFMVGMQKGNPQATAAAIQVCSEYFGESFTMPSNVLFLDNALSNFAGLEKCHSCQSGLCRRCRKLPHDEGRCAICSAAATSGPRIVCDDCFALHPASATWKTLAAIWAALPDRADVSTGDAVSCAVDALAAAPADVAAVAESVLQNLSMPDAIDALAVRWLKDRTPQLTSIITDCGYVARRPPVARVRTALLGKSPGTILSDDGSEILDPLFQAAADADVTTSAAARAELKQLKNPALRDELCRRVVEQGDPVATEIAIAGGYAPCDEQPRIIFFFLTQQWDRYAASDPAGDGMRRAIEYADQSLRQRLRAAAEAGGRFEWVNALLGTHDASRIANVTDDEWPTVAGILASKQQWDELWRLAGAVPLQHSVELLRRLVQSDWVPDGELRPNYMSLQEELLTLPSFTWRLPALGKPTSVPVRKASHIAISPDGRILATKCDTETRIQLWSLPNRQLLHNIELPQGRTRSVAISADGTTLGIAVDQSILRWKLPDVRPLEPITISLPERFLAYWSFTSDGDAGAVFVRGSNLQWWNMTDGKLIVEIPRDVVGVKFSPDGHTLFISRGENSIELWSDKDGSAPYRTLPVSVKSGRMSVSPSGKILLTNSTERTIVATMLLDGSPFSLNQAQLREDIYHFSMSIDDELLATDGNEKRIRLWDLVTRKLVAEVSTWNQTLNSLAMSLDGRTLVYCPELGVTEILDLAPIRVQAICYRPPSTLTRADRDLLEQALRDDKLTKDVRATLQAAAAVVAALGVALPDSSVEGTAVGDKAAPSADEASSTPAGESQPVVEKRIRFACPKCEKVLSASPEHAGKKGRCKYCGERMTIPPAPQ